MESKTAQCTEFMAEPKVTNPSLVDRGNCFVRARLEVSEIKEKYGARAVGVAQPA